MSSHLDNIEVIGLGQACLDYLGRIPSYPQEDGKIELLDLQMQCGGPASTALVTLSRLGISTSFLGSISDDPLGVEILKGLKDENIDTTLLKITTGYTSQFAFIAETGQLITHRPHLLHFCKKYDIPSTLKLSTGQIIKQYAQPTHL